jgi:Domain of unknown function (DUF222)
LSVPAGSFDADRFAQSGPSADMPPDPLLATIVDTVTADPGGSGVAGLSDDQLIGVIAAARRLESRVAWYQLAATAEFTARAGREPLAGEFAAAELACELHLTPLSAGAQMAYAQRVGRRLPACLAGLFAGRLHPVHLRIIDEETQILSAGDAAKADVVLAGMAGPVTFGKLRSAARRLVLELDPAAAAKRKDAARREAEVRVFREESGNAAMIARELPSAEVLASMQHVEQRALDLRAAGVPGPLQDLRVRAYLDLLQERDTRHTQPAPGTGTGTGDGHDDGDGGPGPTDGPSTGRGRPPGADPGPGLAALITITIPWSAWTGRDGVADVDGFGPADADDARDLAAAAARDPRTRWCATVLHPDGTAAAHGCAPGRHPPPGTPATPGSGPGPGSGASPRPEPGSGPGPRPSREPDSGPAAGPDPPPSPDPPTGPDPREWIRRSRIQLTPVARGTCDHAQAEAGYQPSRKLRHLVRARNTRCTAPGCSRPAARCDLDHTIAYDQGGRTCECDLAPLCRHHHRCKQAHGWHLEQPEPGVLIWHTPAGRTYTTGPTQYDSAA